MLNNVFKLRMLENIRYYDHAYYMAIKFDAIKRQIRNKKDIQKVKLNFLRKVKQYRVAQKECNDFDRSFQGHHQ